MHSTNPAPWWRQRARRTARKVNLGWWLGQFLPSALAVCAVAATALLATRWAGADSAAIWPVLGLALLFAGGVCLIVTHGEFMQEAEGLIHLESLHHLHNRLTAAAAGVSDWPPVPTTLSDGFRWRPTRLLVSPVLAVGLLAAAAWAPVTPVDSSAGRTLEEPLAWRQIESWADTLEEEQFLAPEPLREVRERVRQLRDRPMEEWYSHGSLEAGDSLREDTARAVRELARDLQATSAGLAAVETFPQALPAATREAWQAFMDQTLAELADGAFMLDPALLSQLEGVDPSNLRRLTPEEWEALKKLLEQGLKACSACDGIGTNLVAAAGLCWSPAGTPDRGPGEAPMYLQPDKSRLENGALERLQNPSLDRAIPGETLAVRQVEHEIDESLYRGPQTAGSTTAFGAGGESIWKTRLVPDEQAVLQRFFDE